MKFEGSRVLRAHYVETGEANGVKERIGTLDSSGTLCSREPSALCGSYFFLEGGE